MDLQPDLVSCSTRALVNRAYHAEMPFTISIIDSTNSLKTSSLHSFSPPAAFAKRLRIIVLFSSLSAALQSRKHFLSSARYSLLSSLIRTFSSDWSIRAKTSSNVWPISLISSSCSFNHTEKILLNCSVLSRTKRHQPLGDSARDWNRAAKTCQGKSPNLRTRATRKSGVEFFSELSLLFRHGS